MDDTDQAPVDPAMPGDPTGVGAGARVPDRHVGRFRGEDACFSNMHGAPVGWGDAVTPLRLWPCNELPYVLARTLRPDARAEGLAFFERIEARDPGEGSRAIKRWGRGLAIRPDWEAVRNAVMLALVRDKFGRNPALRAHLLATGDGLIQGGNDWGDLYWGVALRTHRRYGIVAGQGENRLGKILMQVRAELRDGVEFVATVP